MIALNIDAAAQVKDGGLDQVDLVRLQLLTLAQLLRPQGETLIMIELSENHCISKLSFDIKMIRMKMSRCASQVLRPCPHWEGSRTSSLSMYNTHSPSSRGCRSC